MLSPSQNASRFLNSRRVRFAAALGFFLVATFSPLTSQALPLQETVYSPDMPAEWTLRQWSQAPKKKAYRIRAEDPTSQEIEALSQFTNYSRLEIGVRRFPSPSEANAWKTLAARGAQLNLLEGVLPSREQLRWVDTLGFQKILIVITGPQDPELTRALGEMKTATSLTLAARAYPKYMDKESWVSIPSEIPLAVSTDFWPGYTQMDMLNLMSMSQAIRVKDMFPNSDSYPYLLNIKRLERITLDTDFDPWDEGEVWTKLASKKVRWNRRSSVPSAEVLRQFAQSAPASHRALTIDSDTELTPSERERLESLPIEVEWLRSQD